MALGAGRDMVERAVGNAIGTGVRYGFGNSAAAAEVVGIGTVGGDGSEHKKKDCVRIVKDAENVKGGDAARFRGIARGNALSAKRCWERLT